MKMNYKAMHEDTYLSLSLRATHPAAWPPVREEHRHAGMTNR